jgi:HAD superfamily hydrolase (TIGR01549 family)
MCIKAIVFDFYGTLIERQQKHFIKLISHNHLQRLKTETRPLSLAALLLNVQQKLMTYDLIQQKIPRDILSLVAPKPYHDSSDIEQSLRESMQREADSAALFPGVNTLLAFLKQRGYRLGLVSNASSYHKAPFYRLGLDRFIDAAVFSCDVGSIKPQTDIYLAACRQLQTAPENVLFVGDSYKSDVLAPRSLGMQAIHVAHFKKTPQNIEHISELGLILFSKSIKHLKHSINDMPEIKQHEISLQQFTLLDARNPHGDLIYHCEGAQSGAAQEFYLRRSAQLQRSEEKKRATAFHDVTEKHQGFPLVLTLGEETFTLSLHNPLAGQSAWKKAPQIAV